MIVAFDTAYWSDHDVSRLSWLAKHLYLWTITNRLARGVDIYKVTALEIAAATGIEAHRLEDLFDETEAVGLASYRGGRVRITRTFVKAAA